LFVIGGPKMRKSLLEKEGAGDETRTRDINLGKLASFLQAAEHQQAWR